MEIIGITMLATLFVGLFVFVGQTEGYKEAVIIFAQAAALIIWISVASFLVGAK